MAMNEAVRWLFWSATVQPPPVRGVACTATQYLPNGEEVGMIPQPFDTRSSASD